jgi:hypothetical protein
MIKLPTIRLKTRTITFDDRLQQIRIIDTTVRHGKIKFLNYKDDDACC